MSYRHAGTDYSVSPGEVLEDFIESRGLDLSAFAVDCGMTTTRIARLIQNEIPFDDEVAAVLGRVLQTDPEMWLNLQEQHEWNEADFDLLCRQMDR